MNGNKTNIYRQINTALLFAAVGLCLVTQYNFYAIRHSTQNAKLLMQVCKLGWAKGSVNAFSKGLNKQPVNFDADYARDSIEIFDIILKNRYNY